MILGRPVASQASPARYTALKNVRAGDSVATGVSDPDVLASATAERKLVYTLITGPPLLQLLGKQLPALGVSIGIAELFYRFPQLYAGVSRLLGDLRRGDLVASIPALLRGRARSPSASEVSREALRRLDPS